MTHVLDTDTLSIWQRGTGVEFANLSARVSAQPPGTVGTTIVSFNEQYQGSVAFLNRARSSADLVRGYARLEKVLATFTSFPVVPFDAAAAAELDALLAARLRVGTMDLRIAAVARSRNLTLVTRNARDFGRVPGLRIEDWTR